MEPAAPGTEDDISSNFPTVSKQVKSKGLIYLFLCSVATLMYINFAEFLVSMFSS